MQAALKTTRRPFLKNLNVADTAFSSLQNIQRKVQQGGELLTDPLQKKISVHFHLPFTFTKFFKDGSYLKLVAGV